MTDRKTFVGRKSGPHADKRLRRLDDFQIENEEEGNRYAIHISLRLIVRADDPVMAAHKAKCHLLFEEDEDLCLTSCNIIENIPTTRKIK